MNPVSHSDMSQKCESGMSPEPHGPLINLVSDDTVALEPHTNILGYLSWYLLPSKTQFKFGLLDIICACLVKYALKL